MQKVAFKKVPLDAKQRRLWDDTLGVISWMGPGFVHLIHTMLHNTGDDELALFTEELNFPAATDGLQLIFKPSVFFQKKLMKRAFMVFHEVFHAMLAHCEAGYFFHKNGVIKLAGHELPYDATFANIVQDLIINAILIMSKLGEYDEEWLYDKDLNAHMEEWVSLYFKLWKANPPPKGPQPNRGPGLPGTGKPGQNGSQPSPSYKPKGKGFDEHLAPGTSQGKDAHEMPERNDAAWDIAINTAMEIQRAQGKLPAAMEHFFQTILKPKVDWTDKVRSELVRISGSGAYSWQKIDRRLAVRGIGAPSVTGHSCGLIVEGFDSSGSIFVDKTLLARFIGETAGMLEDLNPETIKVLTCDTEIKQDIDMHDVDDLRRMEVIKGGGGTDFRPVFDYIDKHGLEPDALIYLTDGVGSFPKHEPDYPVIWGDISGKPEKYPWGRVIFIPTSKD